MRLFLILSCINAIAVRADEPLCNDLLSGLSSEMKVSIRELAKFRFDLDHRVALGLDDLMTRTLREQFEAKRSEIVKTSGLNPNVLSSLIRTEIQKLQQQYDIDVARTHHTRETEAQVSVRAESQIDPIGNLLEPRLRLTQSLLPNGHILVTGGLSESGPHSSIEVLDPHTGISKWVGDLDEAREGHGQTLLPDGRVLVVGGYHDNFDGVYLSSIEAIDPNTGKTKVIGYLKEGRSNHVQILLQDGRVLVLGGCDQEASLSSIEIIDPKTGKSEKIGDLGQAREGFGYALMPDGRVLITGGFSSEDRSSIDILDPKTGKIEKIGDLLEARKHHTQTLLSDGRVLVAGGNQLWGESISSIEVIDPKTGKSEKLGDLVEARSGHAQSLLPDGRVLFTGGFSDDLPLSLVEVFDPDTGSSDEVGNLSDKRTGYAQVVLKDGQVIVMGGSVEDKVLSSMVSIKVGRK